MQDRFKFRFWDKDCEKYVSNERQEQNGLSLYMNNPQSFVTEQCTGLKDKNGKLIYEGDIVKGVDEDIISVEWSDMLLSGSDTMCGFYLGYCFDLIGDCLDCEVIGNIHENAELLK